MNKNNFTKYIHFTVYLSLIVTIICLWNKEPDTPQLDYFCDIENAKNSLPDYPSREILKEKWNKGINISDGSGNKISNNKFIVIEPHDSLCVSGWAIDNDRNCPISDIYMEINDKYIKGIYGLPRPDIHLDLNVASSSYIGFLFHFDRSLLTNDKGEECQKIKFHMIDKEKEMIISDVEYNLIYKSKRPNTPTRSINSSLWGKGLVIDKIIGGTLNNETKTITLNDENIHIAGWCLDIDHNKPFKNIYLAVGNHFYKPIYFASNRPDVRKLFNLPESDQVSYEFVIPQYVLRDEKGKTYEYLEFYVEDQNGEICLPFKYYLK